MTTKLTTQQKTSLTLALLCIGLLLFKAAGLETLVIVGVVMLAIFTGCYITMRMID